MMEQTIDGVFCDLWLTTAVSTRLPIPPGDMIYRQMAVAQQRTEVYVDGADGASGTGSLYLITVQRCDHAS